MLSLADPAAPQPAPFATNASPASARAPGAPPLGAVLARRYRLTEQLGRGGMSVVYAALDVLSGEQVAIKWPRADVGDERERARRIEREAELTGRVRHPHVVRVLGLERHEGTPFLVLEHLRGRTLTDWLKDGPQDPVAFVRMMLPVLRALEAAHRAGVVHRDLKTDNIFLCSGPRGEPHAIKVIDFGIATSLDGRDAPIDKPRKVVGTPHYMAPEQMLDGQVADTRSDVYTLGVVFYRALAFRFPYDADNLSDLALRIVDGSAPPLHELCPWVRRGLSEAIMQALSVEVERRFRTMSAFASALEPYAHASRPSMPASARPSRPVASAPSRRPSAAPSSPVRRSLRISAVGRDMLTGALLLALGALASMGVDYLSAEDPPQPRAALVLSGTR